MKETLQFNGFFVGGYFKIESAILGPIQEIKHRDPAKYCMLRVNSHWYYSDLATPCTRGGNVDPFWNESGSAHAGPYADVGHKAVKRAAEQLVKYGQLEEKRQIQEWLLFAYAYGLVVNPYVLVHKTLHQQYIAALELDIG